MTDYGDYRDLNRANWDDRVPAHVASPDYNVQGFLDDPAYLSGVVRFDRPLLGDVSGLRGVHLQCHIGTDTISLARLGASMTGLDFSAPAVAEATRLAAATGADARFVQSDVHAAVDVLGAGGFDLVYTGVGALTWLPDIRRWARVVAGLLKPGGRLFIRDGHPMMLALDPDEDGRLVLTEPYFETAEARVSDYDGTYVQTDVVMEHTVTHWWNHGIGEIVTALLEAGMTLTGLAEHDSVPWRAFGEAMVSAGDGEWRLARKPERLAASFTIQAVKPVLGPARSGPVAPRPGSVPALWATGPLYPAWWATGPDDPVGPRPGQQAGAEEAGDQAGLDREGEAVDGGGGAAACERVSLVT